MKKYFYTDGISKFGPFSKDELKKQNISLTTKIWYYGLDEWTELSNVSELVDILCLIPPELNSSDLIQKTQSDSDRKIIRTIKTKKDIHIKNYSLLSKVKWLILIFMIILVPIIVYFNSNKQTDADIYNEIVANSYDSNREFDMYIEKYYRDLEVYGIYLKKPQVIIVKFSKIDQIEKTTHIHGVSYGIDDDDRIEIYINPSSWEMFNKPMRYFFMYHELSHDVLKVDDLKAVPINEGKLMYPEIASYENKTMDDFIESYHALFEVYLEK